MNGMPYVFNELNKDYHLLMLGHLKIEKYRGSGLLLMYIVIFLVSLHTKAVKIPPMGLHGGPMQLAVA